METEHIYIDGAKFNIFNAYPRMNGYVTLIVGRGNVREAAHTVPALWYDTRCKSARAITGGHRYSFVPPKIQNVHKGAKP